LRGPSPHAILAGRAIALHGFAHRKWTDASSVVLPLLVPPQTITFARPRKQAARNLSVRGPSAPLARSSSGVKGTGENLRMFRTGPQSERGGMIACTRELAEVARPPRATRPSGPRCVRSRGGPPPPPQTDGRPPSRSAFNGPYSYTLRQGTEPLLGTIRPTGAAVGSRRLVPCPSAR
jgi:hypothetical protein